jgi:hypothetical protein
LVTVLQSSRGTAPGFTFIAPKKNGASPEEQVGPEIVDDRGRPVWFYPLPAGDQATDFRVQRYRGRPVLTWWQGPTRGGVGHAEGVDYIVDQSYHVIATVEAGNDLGADLHEFLITPQATALIVIYHQLAQDLSAVGGSAQGQAIEGIVQEIDIATQRVLFEWHSLDHVGIDESRSPAPTDPATAYDYFHINAVNLDHDGNLLISARNTSAVYKVDRRTGRVIFRLGGKQSDYALGAGVAFAWQHNAIADGFNTIRIFDNESSPEVDPPSKVKWIRRDDLHGTASLVRSIVHPAGLTAGSQGNAQALANGDTFVGFGALGRFSEFNARGELLFDAGLPAGYDTYRAYRETWIGLPDTKPTLSVQRLEDGTATVHAIWNGATEVARWYVWGGSQIAALRPIGTAAWNGLDTSIALQGASQYVAVVAVDAVGRILGRSEAVAVGP